MPNIPGPSEQMRLWTVDEIRAANQAARARDRAILDHECWLYGTVLVGWYLLEEAERFLASWEEEERRNGCLVIRSI